MPGVCACRRACLSVCVCVGGPICLSVCLFASKCVHVCVCVFVCGLCPDLVRRIVCVKDFLVNGLPAYTTAQQAMRGRSDEPSSKIAR